jgi:hypothetical protein
VACLLTPGATDIHFNEPRSTFQLTHIHSCHYLSKTKFSIDGNHYHWAGHGELVEEKTGDVIAQFYPSWNVMDSDEHKIGKMIVKEKGQALLDAVVTTALIVQERSEEGRQAVAFLFHIHH